MKYYSVDYTPGMIYETLKAIDYKVVVSLDIGHGECTAYVYHLNAQGDWVVDPLGVTSNGDQAAASYIAYDQNGKPVIGEVAQDIPGVHIYFKRAPGYWDSCPEGDDKRTYGQLTEDYLRTLWETVKQMNPVSFQDPVTKAPLSNDDILVSVGCPAAAEWIDKGPTGQYIDLVRRATGCQKVAILPESTAAISAAIYAGQAIGKKIDPNKGVAVYDIGSSTLDFTYIWMGKVLLVASIPLGGSDVDQAMLRHVASLYGLELKSTSASVLATAHIKLRKVKESFYTAGAGITISNALLVKLPIPYEMNNLLLEQAAKALGLTSSGDPVALLATVDQDKADNALLDIILRLNDILPGQLSLPARKKLLPGLRTARAAHSSGEKAAYQLEVPVMMQYDVDQSMMDQVLKEDTQVSANKLPINYAGKSWYGCVQQFFSDTHGRLTARGYPCGQVILTGGTSKVTCVREIAEQFYPKDRIYMDPNPSAAVAKGLCQAKGHEVRAAGLTAKLKTDLLERMHAETDPVTKTYTASYYQRFRDGFVRQYFFDRIWTVLTEVVDQLKDGHPHAVEQFQQEIWARTTGDVELSAAFMANVQQDMAAHITDFMDPGSWETKKVKAPTDLALETANRLANQVFMVDAQNAPQLPAGMMLGTVNTMDQQMVARILGSIDLATFIRKRSIEYLYAGKHGAWNRLMQLGKMILIIFGGSTLSAEDISNIAAAIRDEEVQRNAKDHLCKKFAKAMNKTVTQPDGTSIRPMRGAFNRLMLNYLETAMGVALLSLYERSEELDPSQPN